jgi:hypothetical protein
MHRLRPLHYLIATVAIALCAGAVVVLSSGGDDGPRSDADQIAETVSRAYTESDPALCTELLTPKFIKASAYRTLETCRQTAAIGANAQAVEVLDTRVSGDTATALVSARGGSAAPAPVTLRLVKDQGRWKIDGFSGG